MVVTQIIGRQVVVKDSMEQLLVNTMNQRDRFREKAEVLQAEVERLKRENEELKLQLGKRVA